MRKTSKPSVVTKPGPMVRLSESDHKHLAILAKQNSRTLSAEMHLALAEHFRKSGKTMTTPATMPPSTST